MGQITFCTGIGHLNLDELIDPREVTRRFFAEVALLFARSVECTPVTNLSHDEITMAVLNTNSDAFRDSVFDVDYNKDYNSITVLTPNATNVKMFIADGVINVHSNSPLLEELMCDIIISLIRNSDNETYKVGCLTLLYALHKVFNYNPSVVGTYLRAHERCYENLQFLEKESDINKLEQTVVVFNTETEAGDDVICYPHNLVLRGCLLTLLGEVLEYL